LVFHNEQLHRLSGSKKVTRLVLGQASQTLSDSGCSDQQAGILDFAARGELFRLVMAAVADSLDVFLSVLFAGEGGL
jgi:hypothetical protein